MPIDVFDEFYDEDAEDEDKYDPDKPLESYQTHIANQSRKEARRRSSNILNEVGVAPVASEEMLALREVYKEDFVKLHKDVYPDSTGVKPFGPKQQKSIEFGRDIFNKGSGRLLKLEPRGYAKTTRITNEALFAIMSGMQDYIVIVCSNKEKAGEILDSMKTEISNNMKLRELFPGTMACFLHLNNIPQKAPYQTYGGELTHIELGASKLQFPCVPGEPGSGRIIEVRPMKNLKGLHHKVNAGPDAGKIWRPTLFLFDDPQTHDDATSESSVKKIIARIKRDALRGGSHAKRAAAIMAITPVAPGDVAWHFAKNEHSWDVVAYKMLEKRPDEHEWWMEVYAKEYLAYDRTIRGDRTRAALSSCKLVKDNYERIHKGSIVTWEHAYGWGEEPQTEISPVQHAYNVILDDGIVDFEYECQCNVDYGLYEEGEQIHAPVIRIQNKTLPYKRTQVPQETYKMVAHIDINMDILTYVVMTSPEIMRPTIIDYGTWPQQPGIFSKRNLAVPLSTIYPTLTDYRERIYMGLKELIGSLVDRKYVREDGMEVDFSRIGVDIRYEEVYVTRALVESGQKSILRACSGTGVNADDDLLHEKERANALATYENCYLEPNKKRTLDVLHYDANFFKTELHRGFNLEAGVRGSVALFGLESNGEEMSPDRHLPFGQHCNTETPKRDQGKKKKKTKIIWLEKMSQPDNEYFDNSVNCLALLVSEGIPLTVSVSSPEKDKKAKKQDMQDFINSQKRRKKM